VPLLFEVFSQRYERGSIVLTSNLPFEEWPSIFRSERLTGALLDRLTHHVHILEMNGESYRLKQSAGRHRRAIGGGAKPGHRRPGLSLVRQISPTAGATKPRYGAMGRAHSRLRSSATGRKSHRPAGRKSGRR
jgi:hypothetical protein